MPIVIDTNIVLDLFVFKDAAARPLEQLLTDGKLDWIATPAMREELARVLDYPQIVLRRAASTLSSAEILAGFDSQARLVDVASKASVTCRDPDDQKFIDLAVAHRALLLSKDRAVTSMAKRLLAHGVLAQSAM